MAMETSFCMVYLIHSVWSTHANIITFWKTRCNDCQNIAEIHRWHLPNGSRRLMFLYFSEFSCSLGRKVQKKWNSTSNNQYGSMWRKLVKWWFSISLADNLITNWHSSKIMERKNCTILIIGVFYLVVMMLYLIKSP